jgi:hypothetical protein
MTMSQKERQVLSENWDDAKTKVAQHFPGVQPTALGSAPDAEKIAQLTGQDRAQVESTLRSIAQQYSGGDQQ